MPVTSNVNELLLCDPFRSRTTTHVFVARPTPVEDRTLGKLLLVSEIHKPNRVNVDILSAIQDALKTEYYHSEHDTVEAVFEDALAAANERIAELVADFGGEWYRQLDLLVAVTRGCDIHFASVGGIKALLLRRGKIADLLSDTPPSLGGERNPLKTFTNIFSGKLNPDDHLLFFTSAFFDYISQEKLKRLFLDSTPDAAVRHLERLLSENDNNAAFGAIAVSILPDIQPAVAKSLPGLTPSFPQAPQASMETLIAKEAATREILQGSYWHTVRKGIGRSIRRLRVLFRSIILNKPTRFSRALEEQAVSDEPALARRSSLELSQDTYRRSRFLAREKMANLPASVKRAAWRSILAFLHTIRRAPKAMRKVPELSEELRLLPERPRSLLNRMIIAFKRLAPTRRIILILILILAAAFTEGLAVKSRTRSSTTGTAANAVSIQSIETNIEEAQASLLYGDEPRARTLYTLAAATFDKLNARKTDRQARLRVEKSLTDLRTKLRHAFEVNNPKIVIDFQTAKAGAVPTGLRVVGNRAFALDPSDNSFLDVDLTTGKLTTTASPKGLAHFQYGTTAGNTYLALLTNYQVAEIPLTGKSIAAKNMTLPPEANVTAIEFYEGRLYLLDAKNGQIWRALRSGSGYGTATGWFSTPQTELRIPGSLAIDGSIYVLSTSGQAHRYTHGAADTFVLEPVDPALNTGTEIITSGAMKNLYALDSKEKRIVVFDKNGKFLRQFVLSGSADLRDLAVDAKEANAYLLNGSQLLTVPLQAS